MMESKKLEDYNECEYLDEDGEYGFFNEDGSITQELIDHVRSTVEKLKKGKSVWKEEWVEYQVAEVVCELPGIVEITSIDVSSSSGQIAGVGPKEMRQLQEFFKGEN